MINAGTITPQNAAEYSAKSHAPGNSRNNAALRQALTIQLVLHDAVNKVAKDIDNCHDKEIRARLLTALSSAARGWQGLQDTVRILKGDPLPGSLRPTERKRAKNNQEVVSPMPEDSSAPKESLPPP